MPPPAPRDRRLALLGIGLLAVLALQLASAFGLFPEWWASLSLRKLLDPAVLIRGLVLGTALFQSLRWLARPDLSRVSGAAIVLGLTAVFRLTTLKAPIGDWQVLLWATQDWQSIGKWYGSSLIFGAFHHLLGVPIGLSAEESVMLCSSLCGALLILVLARAAARLRLPADALAWRTALLVGFAGYGLALGHREIYSLVLLAVAFTLERWVRLCGEPNAQHAVSAGVTLGLTLTLYLGAVGLVPVALIGLGWLIWRGAWRPAAIAALSCGLVSLLILGLGPPTFERSLLEEWQRQAARGEVLNQHGRPYFLPSDVHWSVITNFVAPRYWLAWWHLRDLAGCLLFAAPLSIPLALYGLLRLTRPPRTGLEDGGWLGLVAAGSFAAIGALVVPGIPLPWDWDLFAFYFTPLIWWSSLQVATEFESRLAVSRARRVVSGSWAYFTVCLALAMCRDTAQPPTEFGPAQSGIAIGAMPAQLPLGSKPFVWLWIRNDTRQPIEIRTDQLELQLVDATKPDRVSSETVKHALRGTRSIPAGASVPLTHFFWTAREGPLAAAARVTTRRARWEVRLQVGPPPGSLEWSSQEIELVAEPAMVQ
jgi:hypothetical protein